MAETDHGKKAEKKIKEWLDRPQDGYDFNRIPDQMSGLFRVSRNICDFDCYKYPYKYYIESKCTEHDRFDFSQLTDTQRNGLRLKAQIIGTYGFVIVCFAYYKRAFVFDIRDIAAIDHDKDIKADDKTYLRIKSVNIKKIDKWPIPYREIRTIPSRKEFLDYEGEIEEYIPISAVPSVCEWKPKP